LKNTDNKYPNLQQMFLKNIPRLSRQMFPAHLMYSSTLFLPSLFYKWMWCFITWWTFNCVLSPSP